MREEVIKMDVGELIKTRRIAKGMTQEELGEIVGVKKSAVAKWETGRVSEIKRSNLKKISEALDLRPTQLLGDVETDPVSTAEEMANIYMDVELRQMIAEYYKLDDQKQAQVREYVHLLSKHQ
jgi:transcriptional regulator with XRE-family HTH domain